MLKTNANLYASEGKRRILIAEDEQINREILGEILKSDYKILYARDGLETMEMIRAHRESLSLVLLDLLMPGMTGLEILKVMREDPELSEIPVIVMTAERDAEVESLKLGATDFIPKPYPHVDVIRARVLRTIELYEDRDIIRSTERDFLTGVYTTEYFYRYVEQLDQFHPDAEMDAAIVDVNHFRMINERYGKAYGDDVLRKIGQALQERASADGGIVCRREADTFMIYSPHIENYEDTLEEVSASLSDENLSSNRVRMRMGVYSVVDKSIGIERRFDYAKMAADTVKDSFNKTVGIYNDELHEKQLFIEQLIEDFPIAIRDQQFQVYYQPKFDIRPDMPLLISAEALVRWEHPELGMVSPGIFIPVFEENGLIEKLDQYVWRAAARQIKDWRDRFKSSIPVSVNVSRIDMSDPNLPAILSEIVQEQGLTSHDFLLEVTESAYTEDSEQIIKMVETLRKEGFRIEMDDFGTGYSSLSMIPHLPIDVLKLDRQFINNAFVDGRNTYMLEVVLRIAEYLSVPVVAEGVETEDQLRALKDLGCDIVQGYFFSKPVPAREFEPFILQKKETEYSLARSFQERIEKKNREKDEQIRRIKREYLTEREKQLEEGQETEGQNAEAETTVEAASQKPTRILAMKRISIAFVIAAAIAAIALLVADISVATGYERMEDASDQYTEAILAASDMETGSDYLTDRVRCFVVSGEIRYLHDFIEEVEVTKTRDHAVDQLKTLLKDTDSSAIRSLDTALTLSNELISVENHAMRLILEAGEYDTADIPESITGIELSEGEKKMTPAELREKALSLVFDDNYTGYKARIRENVRNCTQELIFASRGELERASSFLSFIVNVQTVLTILFFLIVLGIIAIITREIRRPLSNMVAKMREQIVIPEEGVEELRFVTRTYNQILLENREVNEKLSHEASHDALTGLLNRGAYDLLMEDADHQHIALILIDVDYFKAINDTYGHAVGDRILKKVANLMRSSFRSVDILCRIGGDEFVVVMTRVNSSMSQLVLNKIAHMNDMLQNPRDDLPPASLSVGVAFSDRKNPQGDIMRDADTALYQVKEMGRKGCVIFEGMPEKGETE